MEQNRESKSQISKRQKFQARRDQSKDTPRKVQEVRVGWKFRIICERGDEGSER